MRKSFVISALIRAALVSCGAWFATSDYGYAWQPREAQRSETSETFPSATATSAQSAGPATSPVPTPTAISTPIPSVSPSPGITSAPEGSPLVPTGSSQRRTPYGKFQSQAQRFQPRSVQPMPTPSPSAPATSASSPKPPSSPSTTTPGGKLTRQEDNKQKRSEKKELKGERKERFENASPSPTPN